MRTVDTRGEEILSSLIAEFIQSGRAVGSATLAKRLGNRFSPALIRTVMSDLEKVGLLTHRHTSAGRLPTDEGMRYYVDQLLRVDQFSDEQIGEIKSRYRNTSYNVSGILKRTSEILSRVSNYAGLVVTPMMGEIVVRHMEFIPLSKSKVLGIFVGQDGVVENRMIRLGRDFNHAELEKINNYCNRAFYGLTLSEAALKVETEIEEAQKNLDDLIHHALRLSEKLFLDMQSADLFVDGGSHLLQMSDFSDLDRSNTLMDVLEEKKQLIKFLLHWSLFFFSSFFFFKMNYVFLFSTLNH